MEKETVTFHVVFAGDSDKIRDFDFTESSEAIKDAIINSFDLMNGRTEDIEVTFTKKKDGYFVVTATSVPQGTDKMTLNDVIGLLGFLGKDWQKTKEEKLK